MLLLDQNDELRKHMIQIAVQDLILYRYFQAIVKCFFLSSAQKIKDKEMLFFGIYKNTSTVAGQRLSGKCNSNPRVFEGSFMSVVFLFSPIVFFFFFWAAAMLSLTAQFSACGGSVSALWSDGLLPFSEMVSGKHMAIVVANVG